MDKNSFQQFRRSQIAELRPYIPGENMKFPSFVSISEPDRKNGSPKLGDMIARNPANHNDQWLVAAAYFAANFEPLASDDTPPVISEETSNRVASLAGIILTMEAADSEGVDADDYNKLLADAKSLAGSALTQAPDRMKTFVGFFDRLKLERDELNARLLKLGEFMTGNPKARELPEKQRHLLGRQLCLMHDLLTVLDERIVDLEKING